MESRASSGPEEQVQSRDDHADVGHGGANLFILNSDSRLMGTDHHRVAVSVRSRQQRHVHHEERDSNIAVDLTEAIEVIRDGE